MSNLGNCNNNSISTCYEIRNSPEDIVLSKKRVVDFYLKCSVILSLAERGCMQYNSLPENILQNRARILNLLEEDWDILSTPKLRTGGWLRSDSYQIRTPERTKRTTLLNDLFTAIQSAQNDFMTQTIFLFAFLNVEYSSLSPSEQYLLNGLNEKNEIKKARDYYQEDSFDDRDILSSFIKEFGVFPSQMLENFEVEKYRVSVSYCIKFMFKSKIYELEPTQHPFNLFDEVSRGQTFYENFKCFAEMLKKKHEGLSFQSDDFYGVHISDYEISPDEIAQVNNYLSQ